MRAVGGHTLIVNDADSEEGEDPGPSAGRGESLEDIVDIGRRGEAGGAGQHRGEGGARAVDVHGSGGFQDVFGEGRSRRGGMEEFRAVGSHETYSIAGGQES